MVQTQIGSVCLQAQWRCSGRSLAALAQGLLDEADEVWQIGEFGDGLVFAAERGDQAWAVFWGKSMADSAGPLTVLVSRIRPAVPTRQ